MGMSKADEKKLAAVLKQNEAPQTDRKKRLDTIQQLLKSAEGIDMLPHTPLGERLLRQIPYITPMVWIVQAAAVLFFAMVMGQELETIEAAQMLSIIAPAMGLLCIADVVRSFGCNMWEMEAACRYDLRQVTAMRICIIGGMDLLVLGSLLCIFGIYKDSLWEFVLLVLFPFFLASNIYLWELIWFRRKCGYYLLGTTAVILFSLSVFFSSQIYVLQANGFWERIKGSIYLLTAVCMGLLVWNVGRLYRSLKENGKEGRKLWSLE